VLEAHSETSLTSQEALDCTPKISLDQDPLMLVQNCCGSDAESVDRKSSQNNPKKRGKADRTNPPHEEQGTVPHVFFSPFFFVLMRIFPYKTIFFSLQSNTLLGFSSKNMYSNAAPQVSKTNK